MQITTTLDDSVDEDMYVPIAPSRKNRHTNLQMKLCDDPFGDTGLPYRSFLRVDAVYEVPSEILEEQFSYGRHLELQAKSFRSLLHFMNMKGIS
jgi:hypothetical protein